MSFATQLAADVDAVFLNTGEHGETITYFPLGGAPREIVAVVDRRGRDRQDLAHNQVDTDEILVQCGRGATTGMPSPTTGDLVRLAEDPLDRRWAFEAEKHRSAEFIVVLFRRERLRRAGRLKPESL